MKRVFILFVILALCLCGCKKKPEEVPSTPGMQEAPEGVDWRVWEAGIPVTMQMGQEQVNALIVMDEIYLSVYYDRLEQELIGRITILTPLTDLQYSIDHLRVLDMDGDGYDDIRIADMLQNGDRTIDCWVWDADKKEYLYAPEYSQVQTEIGADTSWMEGKILENGVREIPDGIQEILVWLEDQTIHIYLDDREEQLIALAQIPQPLSPEAQEYVQMGLYWDLSDLNGDGWGDLQLPYRWKEDADGSFYQYAYCWIWDEPSQSFALDTLLSNTPME